jgi:2,3-bisphosphoglycerate-independent phosphoglycerate mutase
LKVHSDTPVAVVISGGNVKDDKIEKFSEKDCLKGSLGVLDCGWKLMPKLIRMLREQS